MKQLYFMWVQEDWVLCRVFQKGKQEENNIKLNQHFTFGNFDHVPSLIVQAPSPPASDPSQTAIPCNVDIASISSMALHQSHNHCHSHTGNCSFLHLLQLPQAKDDNAKTDQLFCSKNDSDYGVLWDMDLEEHTFQDGVESNLEQMAFDDVDSSLVFL